MKRYGLIFLLALLVVPSAPVLAQDAPKKAVSIAEALPVLNRLKPLQNPKFGKAESALGRSVLDRSNRIIGHVEDVIVAQDGKIGALRVDFDQLRLGQMVSVRYGNTDITPATNGYKIGLAGDEVVALYPSLLADIQTASGDVFTPSLKTMMGLDVVDPQRDVIGVVSDVIMNQARTELLALYVVLNQGAVRGEGVAVPFSAISFEEQGGVIRAVMSASDVQALLRFMKG